MKTPLLMRFGGGRPWPAGQAALLPEPATMLMLIISNVFITLVQLFLVKPVKCGPFLSIKRSPAWKSDENVVQPSEIYQNSHWHLVRRFFCPKVGLGEESNIVYPWMMQIWGIFSVEFDIRWFVRF
jgi:hypothetical protein